MTNDDGLIDEERRRSDITMAEKLTRRALFGRLRGAGTQLRPPWALDDEEFTEACTQCAECINACPTGIITTGRGGYPIVDLTRGSCTFCGECRDACPSGCFRDASYSPPWPLKAKVKESCLQVNGIACRSCQDTCEHDAISFQPQDGARYDAVVAQDRCTGCGECARACPARAISILEPTG